VGLGREWKRRSQKWIESWRSPPLAACQPPSVATRIWRWSPSMPVPVPVPARLSDADISLKLNSCFLAVS
jgi:hypothetical protein